jgi:hypothetical protein
MKEESGNRNFFTPEVQPMIDLTTSKKAKTFSPHASLVPLGLKLAQLGLFKPVEKLVKIKQKTLRYTPTAKLYAILVAILAGMESMVELNKCLRADPALQAGFGMSGCADQSTVQDTLDACSKDNLTQMEQACAQIYRQFANAPHHNFEQRWLILDSDFTAEPCGLLAESGSKGYFGKLHHHFGRQIGRVLATQYEEIVVERLYGGNVQLISRFQELLEEAEQRLDLSLARRKRTILREDAGAGSVENINWALERGYAYHGKSYGLLSQALLESVEHWVTDPKQPSREVGWVGSQIANPYAKPVVRVAVRCRKNNGQFARAVIVSSLSKELVLELTRQQRLAQPIAESEQALFAYVYFYDQRGGGIETEIKEDRQGLGLGHRHKRHFEGQAVLEQLLALAHNVLIWARGWLAEKEVKISRYGIKRLVRDVFGISGRVKFTKKGWIGHIELNPADPMAKKLRPALASLLPQPPT